jgi:hypothetical protein
VISTISRAVYVQRNVARRDLITELVLFLMWIFVVILAMFLQPDPSGHGTHTQLGLAGCPWLIVYGKPCPTCGLTTCFSAILHGDLALATKAHPLGLLVFAWFAVGAIYYGSKFLFGYKIFAPTRPVLMFNLCLLVVFLGYGVIRMIP